MMQTADNHMPAAQESIVVGLIRVAYQRLGQPAQLLLVTSAQLAVEANQASFNVRKLIPRRCSYFNVTDIGVSAIQHAYHSIKSIADAVIWGRAGSKAESAWSVDSLGRIVCHGLNEASNSSLIIRRNASVLLNDVVFQLIQGILRKRTTLASEDVRHVEAELNGNVPQVGGRGVTRSGLVVGLGPFRDAQRLRKLVLRHATPLSFFLQPRTYFFRKMHLFSFLLFTSALKCIIVHLTPHEIARICTMPNTHITEQARMQAREALEKRGQSAKDFAAQHQLNPSTVYAVLSGQSQCRRGEAHRAAVLLGIKDGVIAQ